MRERIAALEKRLSDLESKEVDEKKLARLWEENKDKARALLGELKKKYKDAIDHQGRPMSEIAEVAEKELEAKP